jgi:hypothetical protein
MQPESFIIFTNFLIGLIVRAVKLDSPGIVKAGCLLREMNYKGFTELPEIPTKEFGFIYDKRVIINK